MQRELDGLKQSTDEAIAKAARAANRVLAQGAERGGQLRERGQVGESPIHCFHTFNPLIPPHYSLTPYSVLTYLSLIHI